MLRSRLLSFPAVLALVLGAGIALPQQAAAIPEPIDRILVVINDGVILQSELDDAMADARTQIAKRGLASPPEIALRAQVLERLVLMRVQTQRAQTAGIRIDDRDLNDILSGLAKQNGLSLSGFADAIRGEGIDYLSLREQIREEALVQRLRAKEVDSHVVVTDIDVDAYLATEGAEGDKEYRLSHILIAVPDGAAQAARDQARAKAADLLKKIRSGEDFAQLAIANSNGQQALQGGDLDWRRAGDLPTAFASLASKMKVGDTSEIIETGSGYHLIKLSETRGGAERKTITETHARHILIQTNAIRNEDQAHTKAREVYRQLQEGGDFVKLAKANSDDPGSKNNGGDLDFQPPGVFVPEFQSQLDALKPGEVSQPFLTQFGWHVATVLERRERDITEDQKRMQARRAIGTRKAGEEYEIWLRRLRNEAYIEFRLPTDAEAAERLS